jgi:tetratricopeptide (TPR) repeat protein/tRNA A-37 threonylcarbamoyl transferase component Bud32
MSLVGKTVGHIRITDRLGSGGMGEVYVGFDETLRRKVAVKTIRRESEILPEARSRFLREARVLSQLDHPHICKVFDYVEGEGGDFLVLELVEGRTLAQRLREGLDRPLKLAVAEKVASALVAAHARGVVHRDVKPSNVMLTEDDDVKVLDFGLARFAHPGGEPDAAGDLDVSRFKAGAEVDEEATTLAAVAPGPDEGETAVRPASTTSLETRRGRVVGTPMYMSPEQARGEAVTAASDMYSYGLLLQELFTGSPPQGEPSDFASLLDRATRAETRPVEGLSADLATLIDRLKSADPTARPSAREAAARLQWIREKPKRRLRTLAAALLVLAAILGVLKYTLDLRRERTQALEARDQAEELVSFLLGLFEVSDPGEARGRTITAREILGKGAERVSRELETRPLTQAKLMEAIGTVYTKLGLYGEAQPLLERSLALREGGTRPGDLVVSDSLVSLAELCDRRARYAEGEALARRALAIREAALGPDHPALPRCLRVLGLLSDKQQEYGEAEALYRRALRIRERSVGTEHPDVAEVLRDLGILYHVQGRYAEAEPLFRRALAIREKALGPDHPDVGGDVNSLAALAFEQHRYEDAEALYRRALNIRRTTLGPDHPDVAVCLVNLAVLHFYRGQTRETEALYRQALAIQEKALGPNHVSVAESLILLGDLLGSLDRKDEAEPLYRRAMAIHEAGLDAQGPLPYAATATSLASLYDDVGRYRDADRLARRALEIRSQALPGDDPLLAESLHNVAHVGHRHLGRHEEAEQLYRRALAIRERKLPADDPALAQTLRDLADLLRSRGRTAEAETLEARIPKPTSPTGQD